MAPPAGCAAPPGVRAGLSVGPAAAAVATSEDVRAIGAMLDDWHAAAAAADEARYFGHLAEGAIFLGTDATERWDKAAFLAYAHPHFARGKAWTFRARRRGVIVDSRELAHFDEELEALGLGPARGSGVVETRDGAWRILQYNLAITVPNERFAITKEAAGTSELLSSRDEALARVALLAGAWVGKDASGASLDEHWTHADGGSLIGAGRTTKDGKTLSFEHLRIEARAKGEVVYIAQPLGKPPTEFRLERSGPEVVSFFNPDHDWPKRLTYRRTEEGLAVRVEGAPGQPTEEWALRPALVVRERP